MENVKQERYPFCCCCGLSVSVNRHQSVKRSIYPRELCDKINHDRLAVAFKMNCSPTNRQHQLYSENSTSNFCLLSVLLTEFLSKFSHLGKRTRNVERDLNIINL